VHTISISQHRNVSAVIDDKNSAALAAQAPDAVGGVQEIVARGLFEAQLQDPHARLEEKVC
jgi:hypothetical protein